MSIATPAAADRRLIAHRVGRQLESLHGKRRWYSPALVKAAMRRCELPDIWDCWAMSLFATRSEFDAWHSARGETCDYAAMNAQMLDSIAPAPTHALPSFGAAAADASGDAGFVLDLLTPDFPDLSS